MILTDETVSIGERIDRAFARIPKLEPLPVKLAVLQPPPCVECGKQVCAFCLKCRNAQCDLVECEFLWCTDVDCDLSMQDCDGSAGDCKGHDDEEEMNGGRDSECLTAEERNPSMLTARYR